jgi:hypothetical protein
MERLYTENALIRYIYKESDFFEIFEVEHAIEFDASTREIYVELCELFEVLPKVQFSPSQNSLDKILAFSRNA